MKPDRYNVAREVRFAKSLHCDLSKNALRSLRTVLQKTGLSLIDGDILYINSAWYVNHSGLLKLAERRHCSGMHTQPVLKSSDPLSSRWVFKATVFKSPKCKGFTGYGDADPSNVSSLVHGAEMRVAETRAVNRALRKAYGIGICSVEEIGSFAGPVQPNREAKQGGKLPPQPVNGNGSGSYGHNGNGNGSRVRDRLCQLIRQHQLDANLVKSYAVDFCGTKTLRDATREQVENFVVHLADWAEKDRNALLCQLNSYSRPKAGAA
jgi:hypothetical protein